MMRSFSQTAIVIVFALAVVGSANCSSTPGLDLAELAAASQYIVIGQVSRLKNKNDFEDTVTVTAVTWLKGVSERDSFVLNLTPRGLVGFDVQLKKGANGVFFLKSIGADDDAVLVHPQSVALLSDVAFFLDK